VTCFSQKQTDSGKTDSSIREPSKHRGVLEKAPLCGAETPTKTSINTQKRRENEQDEETPASQPFPSQIYFLFELF
jgi:hypothetical protein